MINYSDEGIFNKKNKICLIFDPFKIKELQSLKLKHNNLQKLEKFLTSNIKSENKNENEYKELLNLKKVILKNNVKLNLFRIIMLVQKNV